MIGFINYLIRKGYKPCRKNNRGNYIPDNNISYFSSSYSSYLDIRLVKGNKEVVYGLHERGHSPTLIYPRPKGVVTDVDMDKVFLSKSFEEIADMLQL